MNIAKVAAKTRKHHSCTPSFANTTENMPCKPRQPCISTTNPAKKWKWIGLVKQPPHRHGYRRNHSRLHLCRRPFLQWLRLCGSVSVTKPGMLDYGSCSRLSLLWRCYARSGSRQFKNRSCPMFLVHAGHQNKTYHEMAEHYGTAVIPARVRKPQDKGKLRTR